MAKKKTQVLIDLPLDPNPVFNTRVYMLQMERWGFYKIGITSSLNKRIRDIQNGNPVIVKPYWASGWLERSDARHVEGSFHWQLEKFKSKAPFQREWFELSEWQARDTANKLALETERRRINRERRLQKEQALDPNGYQIIGDVPEGYTTARLYALSEGFLPDEISIGSLARTASRMCERKGIAVVKVELTTTPRKDGTYGTMLGTAYPEVILTQALGEMFRNK